MSIEAIAGIAAGELAPLSEAAFAAPELQATTAPETFDALVAALGSVNDKLVASAEGVHELALGQVDNLHQVMMAGEQARLAFDLLLQVRGKVLDAYQELLRMQV